MSSEKLSRMIQVLSFMSQSGGGELYSLDPSVLNCAFNTQTVFVCANEPEKRTFGPRFPAPITTGSIATSEDASAGELVVVTEIVVILLPATAFVAKKL